MMTPVSTLEDAVERLRPRADDIRALGVERLALFGSVSMGRPRPDSDADGLVSFAAGRKASSAFE
jgi:predicted nucleotidyltransferase